VRRFRNIEWEAVASVVAAVVALVPDLLHVVDQSVLLAVMLVLLALLLLGAIRGKGREQRVDDTPRGVAEDVAGMRAALAPPDAILTGDVRA
jgi:hypothetical protein